jgi:predicted membrane protein
MSRQLDLVREEKETKRREALVKALEFELPGLLEIQGITMVGFAVKYDAYECLMTLKADVGGVRQVCFIGASSVIGCILNAVQAARNDRLRWRVDKYHKP